MRLIASIVCLFLCFFVSSCAPKLPPHEAGYGMVAVPFQTINRTTYPIIRTVVLKSSTDASFSIKVSDPPLNSGIVLSEPISQGSYLVDYYEVKAVPVSQINDSLSSQPKKFDRPLNITIDDGEISLLPIGFTVEQYAQSDTIYCNLRTLALDATMHNNYSEKLMQMENNDMWRVKTID